MKSKRKIDRASLDYQYLYTRLHPVMVSDPQKAYKMANTVLFGKGKKTFEALAFCHMLRAYYLFLNNKNKMAVKEIKRYVTDFPKYKFSPVFPDALNMMGIIEDSEHNAYLCLFYLKQALKLCEEHHLEDRLSSITSNLSIPYKRMGDIKTAIYYSDKAISYVNNEKLSARLPLYYFNDADLHAESGDYQTAQKYFDIAEEKYRAIADPDKPFVLPVHMLILKIELDFYLGKEEEFQSDLDEFVKEHQDDQLNIYSLYNYQSLITVLFKAKEYDKMNVFLSKVEKENEVNPQMENEYFIMQIKANYLKTQQDYKGASEAYKKLNELLERLNYRLSDEAESAIQLQMDLAKIKKINKASHKANIVLREESDTDALTGVQNRLAFNQMAKKIDKEMANFETFGCALMDFDCFKNINDTYGHLVGDFVLKKAGLVFKSFTSNQVRIYRYGGDEFAVMFANMGQQEATDLLTKIQAQIGLIRIPSCKDDLTITLSIGLCGENHPSHKVMDYLAKADNALYAIKRKGKNGISHFPY